MLAFVDYLEQGWNRVVPQMFVVSRPIGIEVL